MANIAERVKKVIENQLGVDESEVTETASFTNDLGADSLDNVELIIPYPQQTLGQILLAIGTSVSKPFLNSALSSSALLGLGLSFEYLFLKDAGHLTDGSIVPFSISLQIISQFASRYSNIVSIRVITIEPR